MHRIYINRDADPDLNRYVENLTADNDPFTILAELEEEAGVPLAFSNAKLTAPSPQPQDTSDESEQLDAFERERHCPRIYLDPTDASNFIEVPSKFN